MHYILHTVMLQIMDDVVVLIRDVRRCPIILLAFAVVIVIAAATARAFRRYG